MLKNYIWRGLEWQFEEGTQPKEAVELKPAEPNEETDPEVNNEESA